MNTQKDLEEMKEIEDNIISYESQFEIAKMNNWDNEGFNALECVSSLKQNAQQIAERNVFKGGCGKNIYSFTVPGVILFKCGKDYSISNRKDIPNIPLCPECQDKKEDCDEIQEIWERIK